MIVDFHLSSFVMAHVCVVQLHMQSSYSIVVWGNLNSSLDK
jgi:hypothetical protein